MPTEPATCPHRPPCPGCPRWGEPGIAPAAAEKLRGIAREAGIMAPTVHSGSALTFRHRARLMVRGRSASPKVGIFQTSSHRIADIPRCRVHHPLVNRVAAALRRTARETGLQPYADRPHVGHLRSVQIVVERGSQTAQVVVVANARIPGSTLALLDRLTDELGRDLHSLWWNGNPARTNTILGPHWHHCTGPEFVREQIGSASVFFPPGAFGQSHLELADAMVELVQGWVPDGAHIAELHAGCGSFGLGLLRRASRVVFNERSEHASRGLERGIAERPPDERNRAWIARGAAADRLDILGGADVGIVDPPRRGLEPEVIAGLVRARPTRLIYVSCEPDALRRDLEALVRGGFRLAALEAFDCFPYTEHIESVALLN